MTSLPVTVQRYTDFFPWPLPIRPPILLFLEHTNHLIQFNWDDALKLGHEDLKFNTSGDFPEFSITPPR